MGGGPGSRQQEPSGGGAGGNYLATTRSLERRGTAGAERVEEEELSVATRTLRAVEPARRVGAVAGAGGECEASALQSCVLTGEEAAPHTPELRDELRAVAEGAGRHGVAPAALGGARRGDEAEKLVRAENQITTRDYVTYLQDNRGSSCGLRGALALLAL